MIKSYNSYGLYKLLPVFENILMMVKFGEYKMELHVVFHCIGVTIFPSAGYQPYCIL